jgi:hypothetical protein
MSTHEWEDALNQLVKISKGDFKPTEKVTLKIPCYKIDSRLENIRDCRMLTHKKGKPAPYNSKKGAYPYLLAEVNIDTLTEGGKKIADCWTGGKYHTATVKGDECIVPSMRGEFYSYDVKEIFRTWQIPVEITAIDFINDCAERLEQKGLSEKQAWIDRAAIIDA